ncbi:hypothetical protein J6590_034720 [Homalodisca vitripennis]|nr:hypothetical protein J6590_034720 [Homalodisca vitripennis]
MAVLRPGGASSRQLTTGQNAADGTLAVYTITIGVQWPFVGALTACDTHPSTPSQRRPLSTLAPLPSKYVLYDIIKRHYCDFPSIKQVLR